MADRQRVLHFARLHRFGPDDRGATAVEFGIVAVPFFMFLFALVGCSLYFFVVSSLESGMDRTSRLIRTGEAITQKMTVNQFKQMVCTDAGGWIQCDHMQIFAQHWANWSDPTLAPHQCVDQNNTVVQNSAPGSDPIATYSGTASDVVIVTVCYKWDFAAKIPFLRLGNMQDGSMMMQTATAFRTEPYPGS